MSDQGPAQQQLSEEELKAYLGQLREAPVTEVVAQTVSVLLNAAQVKLGRPDGRALIDVVAAIRDAAEEAVDDRLVSELDNALSQLRMAQVEAEKQGQAAAQAPTDEVDVPGPGTAVPPEGSDEGSSGSGASRLWTPGQ